MTKPDLSYIIDNDLRHAGDPSPTIDDFKNYMGDVCVCFRDKFFYTYPQDLKKVQKDAPHDHNIFIICAKNQALN